LVMTPAILDDAFASGAGVNSPPEEPPYLARTAPQPWTDDYPQEFRDLLAAGAGYSFEPGGAESAYGAGYYVSSERRMYDVQADAAGRGRGMVTARRSPLGRDTTIVYDSYTLLPSTIKDPIGLPTAAKHEYRVLQPAQITDPNGNLTLFTWITYRPQGFRYRWRRR
jgi:hypothetical protein